MGPPCSAVPGKAMLVPGQERMRRPSAAPPEDKSDGSMFEYVPVDWARADDEVRQSLFEVAARHGFEPAAAAARPEPQPWRLSKAAKRSVVAMGAAAAGRRASTLPDRAARLSVASAAQHRESLERIGRAA
eukprot:EG_transcript_45786